MTAIGIGIIFCLLYFSLLAWLWIQRKGSPVQQRGQKILRVIGILVLILLTMVAFQYLALVFVGMHMRHWR